MQILIYLPVVKWLKEGIVPPTCELCLQSPATKFIVAVQKPTALETWGAFLLMDR